MPTIIRQEHVQLCFLHTVAITSRANLLLRMSKTETPKLQIRYGQCTMKMFCSFVHCPDLVYKSSVSLLDSYNETFASCMRRMLMKVTALKSHCNSVLTDLLLSAIYTSYAQALLAVHSLQTITVVQPYRVCMKTHCSMLTL